MTVDRVIKVLTAMGGICSQICYKLVIRLHSHDMGITCYQHDVDLWSKQKGLPDLWGGDGARPDRPLLENSTAC